MALTLGRGRRCNAAALAIAAVAAVGLIASHARTAAAGTAAEPWPSFTMTWLETGAGLGLNGATGTQLFRLDYTDRRHFRTALLETPAVPGAVGSTWTFDGRTSTFHDARHGTDQVTPYNPDELTVPDEWLVPGRIAYLLAQPGYTSASIGNGLATLRHEATYPDGRTLGEEITYRLADGIPMRRIHRVNGVEVGRREAVEFRLGRP